MTLQKPEDQTGRHRNVGFGVFLLLAGLVLLSEKLGWIPNSVDWFIPVLLIAWGASEIYQRVKWT